MRVNYSQNDIFIWIYLPFIVQALLLVPNMLKAQKIRSITRGIPARSRPWLISPYLFGIAGPTGDMGPVSQFSVCV